MIRLLITFVLLFPVFSFGCADALYSESARSYFSKQVGELTEKSRQEKAEAMWNAFSKASWAIAYAHTLNSEIAMGVVHQAMHVVFEKNIWDIDSFRSKIIVTTRELARSVAAPLFAPLFGQGPSAKTPRILQDVPDLKQLLEQFEVMDREILTLRYAFDWPVDLIAYFYGAQPHLVQATLDRTKALARAYLASHEDK